MKTLLFIALFALCACAKEDKYEYGYYGQKYVTFDNQTTCQIQVVIEKWGAGLWIYPDSPICKQPEYNDFQQSIFARRYIVYAWVDGSIEYVGHSTVQYYNIITLTNLAKDTIIINNLKK